MVKIKIFCNDNIDRITKEVNDFIADKIIFNIQYQTFPVTTKYSSTGVPLSASIFDRVLVMYSEEKEYDPCHEMKEV